MVSVVLAAGVVGDLVGGTLVGEVEPVVSALVIGCRDVVSEALL